MLCETTPTGQEHGEIAALLTAELVVFVRSEALGRITTSETRTLDVYRPDQAVATLGEQDALDGLDVLPGFTCEVSAVFGPQPAHESPGEDQSRS